MTGLLDDQQHQSLNINLNPPIYLDPNRKYVLGVIGMETFNHIPNVTRDNHTFAYRKDDVLQRIEFPIGTYSAKDILQYLRDQMGQDALEIILNNNTFQTKLKCNYDIDFSVTGSIGRLLGFHNKIYKRNQWHTSENHIQIINVNALTILCSICGGSYKNGQESHIIQQFFTTVPPGFKVVEKPSQPIYLPILTNTITEIVLQIEDENGKPVNFNGELVTLTLHLKNGF